MLKVKEFKSSIEEPSIQEATEEFLKRISADDIVDFEYATNAVQYKKTDGTTGVILLSSAIFIYDERN